MFNEGAIVGGDFRLLRPLAAGGMGSVYVAEQLSTGQKRALKLMHTSLLDDPRLRERFAQEARIGAQVPSQHVVQVIAAGVDPQLQVPWLAMELLAGEDLGAHISRRGTLALIEVLRIFRQLCHALGAAHSMGIVHRDMKPENVFLASVQSADTSTQVKVLDFGIAKLMADARASGTAQVGTPLWMAPEQSDPRSPVKPTADVWPLGLMAFRLLTGKHYWKTANESDGALSALFRESLFEPLVPASERAEAYGAGALLPAGFDAWFARCVVREPGHRFQDAREAFSALEAMSAALGVVSGASAVAWQSAPPPASVSQPSSAVSRRSSSVLGLSIALALVLALGFVVVLALGAYVFRAQLATLAGASPTAPDSEPVAAPSGETPQREAATAAAANSEASSDEPPASSGARAARGENRAAPATSNSPALAASREPEKASGSDKVATSSGLKPIDRPAVERRISEEARAASTECRSKKSPDAGAETYSGSRGFRPDGTTTTGFRGAGGSRACVFEKMRRMSIGRYAHPDEWHVESFTFSVTVQ